MSGVDFLLDTNFILGMLKSSPAVLESLTARRLTADKCAFSAVTKMELLGFPDITPDEERLIRATLDQLRYLAINLEVEEAAIAIRRARRVKLPDALIAATAVCHGLELLTLDTGLLAVYEAVRASA